MKTPQYADLKGVPEDVRIDLIGKGTLAGRLVTGFLVEDEAKADRYIAKLKARFPSIVVVGKFHGRNSNVWCVKVRPPEFSAN